MRCSVAGAILLAASAHAQSKELLADNAVAEPSDTLVLRARRVWRRRRADLERAALAKGQDLTPSCCSCADCKGCSRRDGDAVAARRLGVKDELEELRRKREGVKPSMQDELEELKRKRAAVEPSTAQRQREALEFEQRLAEEAAEDREADFAQDKENLLRPRRPLGAAQFDAPTRAPEAEPSTPRNPQEVRTTTMMPGWWQHSVQPPWPDDAVPEFLVMSSGVQMPRLLFSPYPNKETAEAIMLEAVQAGFKGLDIPPGPSEAGAKRALKALFDSGLARDALFIQIKVCPWHANSISAQVELLVRRAVRNLGLTYVDSVLLQEPYPDEHEQIMEAWRALEEHAIGKGKARLLGIADEMRIAELLRLYKDATAKPALAYHRASGLPGYRAKCPPNLTLLTHSPFSPGLHTHFFDAEPAKGKLGTFKHVYHPPDIVTTGTLQELVDRYDVGLRSLSLRFLLGLGVVPLTGAATSEHMNSDLAAFNINLADSDGERIKNYLDRFSRKRLAKSEEDCCQICEDLVQRPPGVISVSAWAVLGVVAGSGLALARPRCGASLHPTRVKLLLESRS